MARHYADQGLALMEGYTRGRQAVKDWQNDTIEANAGDAYKNTGQTTGTDSSFGKVGLNDIYSGPGADGVKTNAEAASEGIMQPTETKTNYTLAGKTRDKEFSDSEVEAARNRAAADVYSTAGKFEKSSELRKNAAQMGLTELQMTSAQRTERQAVDDEAFKNVMKGHMGEYSGIGNDADGNPLTPAAALEAKSIAYQKMKGAALANPTAAREWMPAMEEAKKQALASHLAANTPGVDATNSQIVSYIKDSAAASAKFGDVMNPTELRAAQENIKKMNKEGYTDALEAAQRGDLKEANRLWNSAGSMKGELISLTPGKMSPEMGGMKTMIATYRDSEGQTHTINVGDSLAQAQSLKERVDMSTKVQDSASKKQSANAESSKASTAASSATAAIRKENLQSAEMEQTQAGELAWAKRSKDPKAPLTLAEQAGLDHVVGKAAMARDAKDGYKVEGTEVSNMLGDPAVNDKGHPITDPLTGKQYVNRNPKEEAKFFAWAESKGIRDTNKALSLYMAEKGNANAAASVKVAPAEAIAAVKADPRLAADFEKKYGYKYKE